MARGMTARPLAAPRPSVAVRKRIARRTPAILSSVVTTDKAGLPPGEIRDLARWEAGGAIDSRHALKLARLQRVLTMLDDMVTREYRLAFFEQAHPLLMHLRPIDLLDTEEGMRAILRQLEAAATGSFA